MGADGVENVGHARLRSHGPDGLQQEVVRWAQEWKIQPPPITLMDMADVGAAHELIQSGRSVGKIVLRTPVADQEVIQ